MNLENIVNELTVEKQRIDAVLSVIQQQLPQTLPTSTELSTAESVSDSTSLPNPAYRGMSVASRKKISKSMKERWATRKRRKVSPEVRERISAAQKARWAKLHSASKQLSDRPPMQVATAA